MKDNSNFLVILKTMQERKYSSGTHLAILKRLAELKKQGKDIAPQVLKILMRTENEKEVLKNVMDL